MASEKLYKWLNFTALGMRLFVTTMPTGDKRLVMMGGDKYPNQMKRLGFNLLGGLWLRRDIKIDFAMVRREFPDTPGSPRVFSQDMKRGDIVRVMRDKLAPTTEEIEAKIALTKALPLGLNYLGQEVFEGNEGRFIRQQQKTVVRESDNMHSLFLRAVTEADIELCADGLMVGLMGGRIYRTEDINRFAEIIYGKPTAQDTPQMDQLHTAIGHALARRMLTETTDTQEDKFALAIKLHEGLPPVSAEYAEQIVTMPMGVIAQILVGEVANKEGAVIRMPSIGNGAFLSTIRGVTIQTTSSDSNQPLAELSGNSFTPLTGNIRHNVALESLNYQKLDKEIDVDGLKISRADHLEIIDSLKHRMDTGRSVFSFRAPAKHGEIDEDTTRLLAWISARYEVDGLAQMDSHLFGRGSEISNRFMLAVGKRGSRLYDAEKNVKVVYDYSELLNWSEDVVIARDSSVARKKRSIEENTHQSPYIPSSQISEPKAMIPRNLAGPTREALSKIEAKFGNLDHWVASELGYRNEELGQWLDAEQVDAVAMAIDAHMRGRGFIEADQTGLGKGRVLAAMARWAIMNGQKVIFVTEKPNLFSDFFRDLRDIDSDKLVKHRCLNQGVNIRLEGVKIHNGSKKEDIEAMVNSGEIPDSVNMVMATYSQFNREASDKDGMTKKALWLSQVAAGTMLILDESHNAAGTSSNTGVNIARAVSMSNNVIYSSATYAKGSKNFSVYSKIMPDSLKGSNITAVLAAGGEALMEVFSSNLARDGVLIRREHDMTELQFIDEEDTNRRERNEDLANKMANILEVMGLLCGEIDTFVNDKNKLIKVATKLAIKSGAGRSNKRNGFLPANFGARLYGLQRQFMLCLGVDLAAEKAIQALNEGRKPVIVLENTNESLLKDALARREEFLSEDADLEDSDFDDEEVDDMESMTDVEAELYTGGARILQQPITFRDVLSKALERMCIVKLVTPTSSVSERLEIESVKKFRASIELMIDAFPDMPASPIDILRERIELAGYSCSEISGRSMGLAYNDDGSQTVISITGTSDRLAVIEKFNNGVSDAVVLTNAGSTGISLHASKTFKDQRQRELIELQIPNDVAKRMQFYGRVNRKNQVCPPIIRTLCSGLPSEIRLLSMQNQKMRALSANTTSNQDATNLSHNIPDLLNEIGDDVCRKYMMQNLSLPAKLAISLYKLSDDYAKKTPKTWYADQLTGRLGMLQVQDQLDVYEEITSNYNVEIADLESRGINPFKTTEYDFKAKIVSRQILQGATGGESVFDEPLYLTKIEYTELVEAISVEAIKARIEGSISELRDDPRVTSRHYNVFYGIVNILKATEKERLSRALSGEFKTVDEALAAEGNNIVKSIRNKLKILKDILPYIQPGKAVSYSDAMGEHEGIIVSMSMPKMGKEHLMGEYGMRIARPGQEATVTTLNGFLNMSGKLIGKEDLILNRFRDVKHGESLRYRTLIDGNMFMAANKSFNEKIGSSVVYTDEKGVSQRGVLLPKTRAAEMLEHLSVENNIGLGQSFAGEVIMSSFSNGLKFTSSKYQYDNQPLVLQSLNSMEFTLKLSTSGPTGTMLLTNKNILSMMGNFVKEAGYASGIISVTKIPQLILEVYTAGFVLFAPHELEPIISAKLLAFKNKNGPKL